MAFEITTGIVVFTAIVLILALIVLGVRMILIGNGPVTVTLNERQDIEAGSGTILLDALAQVGFHIPSTCGGKGTCGLCRARITAGARDPIPVETAKISRADLNQGERLACQIKLNQDIGVQLPDEILNAGTWRCRVRSNENVASLIKELQLDLPDDATMDFRAGSFVELTAPPYDLKFSDFEIAPRYGDIWERLELFGLTASSDTETTRAYSLANHSAENKTLKLNIRIALPPPGRAGDVPPGIVSSFLYGLKPGDEITMSGPFGRFFPSETEADMIYVGGGAGMAPMRAHIFDLLINQKTKRQISFWYGARSRQELFYQDELDELATRFENFDWHVALSDPDPADNWDGLTGFIHEACYEKFLKDHPNPEECEFYLCGPPMMVKSVTRMLDRLGVDEDNIFFDDFGS